MFFVISKLLGYLLQPLVIFIALLLIGAALLWTRFQRVARWLVLLPAITMAVIAFTPVNFLLLGSLEYRIEKPPLPQEVDGIIVLGGSFDNLISSAMKTAEMRDSADRVTEAVALARKFPDATILFTGGANSLTSQTRPEAEFANKVFSDLGIAGHNIIYENQARNTHENAVNSLSLVKPGKDETWLLITSAYHMPRSYSIFRKAGWQNLVPWPVDYHTRGWEDKGRISSSTRKHFNNVEIATREYIGLLAYWLTGRTDELFPTVHQSDR